VQRLYQGVKTWIMDRLGKVFDFVKGKIDAVKGWFYGLYDAVVGNSYVPDMVDGIAEHMKRLDAVMVAPVTAATTKAQEAFRDMAANVQGILDRLFPEVRRLLTFREELAAIEGAGFSPDLESAARGQLLGELAGGSGIGTPNLPDVGPLGDLDKGLKAFEDFAERLTKKSRETTVRIAKSFKDMADETLGALQRMTDAIKGGGFLDILQGVFGFAMQLGSIGVFGSKIATNLNKSVPGLANGGTGIIGGFGGKDTNMLSLNGSPLARVSRGERLTVSPEGGGRGGVMEIRPSPLFDVYVDGKLVQAAPGIAAAGGQVGMANMARHQSRRWR
jgi:hypothetical protein